MSLATSFPCRVFGIPLGLIAIAAAVFSTSCGGGGMSGGPTFSGNTSVSMVVTSTANDQLSEFDLAFQSITLTSQSGKTATLLSAPMSGPTVGAEFMHINGTAEPLVTAIIPQDIYTSATVSLSFGEFVCIALGQVDGQEGLSSAFYSGSVPASAITVTLPSPITVTGASMALSLDLLISQSATIGDCLNVNGFSGFSMTPSFNLAPLTLVPSPTNAANGKVTGLDGEIAAVGTNGEGFTLSITYAEGVRPLSVSSSSSTVYQGVSGFSTLAVGTFVDMDGAIQTDGSVLATRIAVEDPSAGDVVRGPLMEVNPSGSTLLMHAREQQGKNFPGYVGGFGGFNFGSAAFQISQQLTNMGNLPFVPSFTASTMVPGQEVYISAAVIPPGGYPVASTVTLMPQTINAKVVGSSTSGSFTDYTVSLASYDLFPMLAVQPNQTTVENNPNQIEVYVDSNTQLLNTQALAVGSELRFYGLVFNDNGTLRMDCVQVSDGVDFSAQPNAVQRNHMEKGVAQEIRREDFGSRQETIRVTTRQP